MKRTVFYEQHLKLGAKMVPFAGFEMPVEYSGVKMEHLRVRENIGLFDVSHMGEIRITGKGAYHLVQKLTSNDAARLVPGMVQYTCMPNEKGGIVDDLLVYCESEQEYMLVVNASNVKKDHQWILGHQTEETQVDNLSDQISLLAVQGPRAGELLARLTPADLDSIPYYHFTHGEVAGVNDVIISHTGYTGAGGYELYMANDSALNVWKALFEEGKDLGLLPAGLAARDTLRLEMGYCLYGNDIDETTSPIEAGLGWITRFTEGNDFINRPALEKQKADGPKRRLTGFTMLERGIPRQHYPILDSEGKSIGEVTSGTMSPMLQRGIGMGYVDTAYSRVDTEIRIGIRNKQLRAVTERPPFYRPES